MEPLPKLSSYARVVLTERLRAYWELLKLRFAAEAEDDVTRAEERHRGRNDI